MSAGTAILTAAALIVLPGLLLGLGTGLRGWLAAGAAPALTLGTISLAATLLRVLGVSWNLVSATAMVTALVVVVGLVLRTWRVPGLLPQPGWRAVAPALALVAAGAVGATAISRATVGLSRVNQSWDALFHSSAIHFIADTGLSAPAALAAVAQPANPNFYYPNIYHLIGALQLEIVGGNAAQAVNALAAALPFVFALSVVGLLAAFHAPTVTLVMGAAAAVMFSAFPYNIIVYGALFPFATAIAAAPGLVALTEHLVKRPRAVTALVTGVAGVGLLATHPSVAVFAGAWCLLHVMIAVATRRAGVVTLLAPLALVIAVGLVGAFPVIYSLRASPAAAASVQRAPFTDGGSAVGQVLFFSTNIGTPQWVLGIALLAGVMLCLRRRILWSTYAMLVLVVVFYVLSTSYTTSITALWWDDFSRFAALSTLPAAMFVANLLGGASIEVGKGIDRLLGRVVASKVHRWRLGTALGTALILLVGALATSGGYLQRQVNYVSSAYRDGPTLSTGEEVAYDFLRSVDVRGSVLNDPQDGSPYAYGLFDVPVLFKAPITPPVSDRDIGADRFLLLEHFRDIGNDTAVQAAAVRLKVRYVLVGEGFLVPGEIRAPGLVALGSVSALTRVFDNGSAQVYKVDLGRFSPGD